MRPIKLLAPVALLAVFLGAAPAGAQTSINKVAIANPGKILAGLQETNDLNAKLGNDRKALEATDQEKRVKIRDLQTQRDQLKPDSPLYADRNKELAQASIEYEVWKQVTAAELQRSQKQQLRSLYDKISAAIGSVAQEKGIDLVIAEQRPELPADMEQINVQQVQMMLSQRNVMFSSAKVDISDQVVAAMDAKYKSGK